MATFLRDGDPYDAATTTADYVATAVGAESNVAAGMAQLGCRTRWISRLGDDELGRLVRDIVADYGVDVQVTWDPVQPTGLLVKELGPSGTRVRYYRSESAARRLCEDDVANCGLARWMHVTGITPALSPASAQLVEAIVAGRIRCAERISFDVNYRASLWPDAESAARVILPLAARADIVFIGDDEAEVLLGTTDAAEVARKLLTDTDQEVLVKRGAGPASVVTLAGEVTEPALAAEVVDATGAGDAFAAGYLAAECWGWEARDRLRLGHFLAARAVGEVSDQGPPLTSDEVERLQMSPTALASLWASESHR